MNILRTDDSYAELYQDRSHLFSRPMKKKCKHSEFKKILDRTMKSENEDWEEFRVLLPKHGHFWDNGYEDLE